MKLEPCPRCNFPDPVVEINHEGGYQVTCPTCNTFQPRSYSTQSDAIQSWNMEGVVITCVVHRPPRNEASAIPTQGTPA